MQNKYLILVAFVMLLYGSSTGLAGPSVLGSAQSFAVLGGSTVTNTGSTTITGNLGVSPGSAVTGFPPGLVNGGTIYGPGAESSQAQSDVTKAYDALKGLAPYGYNSGILTGTDLGGLTLTPGVYHFNTSAQLTGALTLDAQFNDNAYWVFQIGSTLTTAPGSSVVLSNLSTNDGIYNGLYWQVGSSATLDTDTTFEGNILALTSITLNTGATIPNGRALARNGAVTLDNNVISIVCPNGGPGYSGGLEFVEGELVPIGPGSPVIPVPGAFLLVAIGMASLSVFRKRTSILN